MRGFVDAGHELVESGCPIVEHLGLALLLGEVNDAGWSVDLDFQRAVVDELGEEFFGVRLLEFQQLSHAGSADTGVVIGDDANVLKILKSSRNELNLESDQTYMFGETVSQLFPALLAVGSVLLEDGQRL